MQARRRSLPPPWERRREAPQHPIGRARRRWPRAYDGPEPAREHLNPRYHRAYDGARNPADRSRRSRSPFAFQNLRQSPVRNGLIGLAIAGAAAPIGVHRYQTALRTDASHERVMAHVGDVEALNDGAVTEAWTEMETAATTETAESQREAIIEEALETHRKFKLTRQLAEDIYEAATEFDVDPRVAFGLVRAESGFRNTATSPVGAKGLTQLMPRTAAWMQPGTKASDLRDQKTNLRIGFKYLSYLVNKYDGDTRLALLAYNRGPGTVDKALKQGKNPDNGYADFVAGKANHGHKLYTNAE